METLVRHGQTVNKMYEAFSKGDIPFILSKLHPDVIWEAMGHPDIPYAGIYHGPDDVKLFFEKLVESTDFKEMVPEHILENGNIVIATGYAKGVALKTNKLLASIWAMIYEFDDDGKIVHFRDCVDTLALSRGYAE
jgi:ketosteroid isomerase-like protein